MYTGASVPDNLNALGFEFISDGNSSARYIYNSEGHVGRSDLKTWRRKDDWQSEATRKTRARSLGAGRGSRLAGRGSRLASQ